MIFEEYIFKARVRNCSPPRHQAILNSNRSKRACLDMLATSPPMIFKINLSNHVSELARHLATNELLIHMVQREPVWLCSPPMMFKNDFSKLVSKMARHLATREFWIHIHQRESVWISSPPRHQGFVSNHFAKLVSGLAHHLAIIELLKTYCSKGAFLGFSTTSDFEALYVKVWDKTSI